jgi:hypothetical protein
VVVDLVGDFLRITLIETPREVWQSKPRHAQRLNGELDAVEEPVLIDIQSAGQAK